MDSRQQFEEWITKQEWFDGCSIERGGFTDYIDAFTYSQWVSWQASREAVVVDLPASYRSAGSKFELLNKQHMIDALTVLGIRTK